MATQSILIVDDEALIRLALHDELSRDFQSVKEACDGKRALEMIERENFDLVILDMIMPEMEGSELLRRIRTLRPRTRIIAMSGGGRRGPAAFLAVARKLGADEVLEKPFTRTALRHAILRLLGSSHRTAAAPVPVHC